MPGHRAPCPLCIPDAPADRAEFREYAELIAGQIDGATTTRAALFALSSLCNVMAARSGELQKRNGKVVMLTAQYIRDVGRLLRPGDDDERRLLPSGDFPPLEIAPS